MKDSFRSPGAYSPRLRATLSPSIGMYPRVTSGAGRTTRIFSLSGRSKNSRETSSTAAIRSDGTRWPAMTRKPMSRQASPISRATARLWASTPDQYGAMSTTGTVSHVMTSLLLLVVEHRRTVGREPDLSGRGQPVVLHPRHRLLQRRLHRRMIPRLERDQRLGEHVLQLEVADVHPLRGNGGAPPRPADPGPARRACDRRTPCTLDGSRRCRRTSVPTG